MEKNTCIRVLADPVQIRQCKEEIAGKKGAFNRLSSVLSLAGNEVRLKILYLLDLEKELCPCDLSDILQMSIPAVSQHLRKMKDGGLIEARKAGQTIFYSVCVDHLKTLRPFFKQIRETNLKQEV
ncbi:MAG: winged helix-turn-helix transcriptional regulator [Cyclobacteriaceae bacterium]|nr:winged helix-turn-helix transcriptional regulator [Cyclobacteriaceae bacterium]